jgi:hypothetical protein
MKATRLVELKEEAKSLPEGIAVRISGPELLWLLEQLETADIARADAAVRDSDDGRAAEPAPIVGRVTW